MVGAGVGCLGLEAGRGGGLGGVGGRESGGAWGGV